MTAVILRGDAACLPLPDESVDLIVTSPPYFGLRSYTDGGEVYDGQVGSEETPREYVAKLLDCTRKWVRALKPGGSIFVNLGDKYSTYTGANWGNGRSLDGVRGTAKVPHGGPVNAPEVYGVPYKSLMLLPQRYAIGCVDDLGLILRAEIVWAKPNAMPESVTDRVRRAHEQVFHFTKQPRYFAAVDEIRQPLVDPHRQAGANAFRARNASLPGGMAAYKGPNPLGALPGSMWEIPSAPLVIPPAVAHARCCGGLDPDCDKGLAHHAAYPPELCRRVILGWSPPGICTRCGEGRRPVTHIDHEPGWVRATDGGRHRSGDGNPGERAGQVVNNRRLVTVTGYACACPQPDAPVRPAVVLDPFAGTGTTMLTASALGRIGVGIDRSADYCRIAAWRTADPGERARALGVRKPPPVTGGQGSLFDGLEAS